MIYAASALALLCGIAGGAAITWWRTRRTSSPLQRGSGQKPLATRADDGEVRRYNMANNAMGKLLDAEQFDAAYTIARNWCNRAPVFADGWTKLYGEFTVTQMPPVEYAARHLVALRDVGELRRLREIMMSHNELKPWQDLLADEIVAASELDRIFNLVERNPGIAQTTAVRRVDAGMRRAMEALRDADLRDLVRRERSGRSYVLYRE